MIQAMDPWPGVTSLEPEAPWVPRLDRNWGGCAGQ